MLPAAYRKPFGLGELTLELFPAGHVLGSAQIRVTGGSRVALGYTGDLCIEPTRTAEPAELMRCDVLLMESTFGLPRYVFPPKEEVLAEVRRFVDDALSDGVTPVLLGYSLGKAQGILKHLGELGYACRAHPVVHAVNRVYEDQGVALPNVRALGAEGPGRDEVVVAPPHLARSAAMFRIRRRRTAILTGWAIDGSHHFRGGGRGLPALRPRRLPVARALRPGDGCEPRLHAARARRTARQGAAARGDPRRADDFGAAARAPVTSGLARRRATG